MTKSVRADCPESAAQLWEEFLSNKKGVPRWLFGVNEYSSAISKIVEINGFIDDFSMRTSYMGKPVKKLKQVPTDSLIISCVTASYPVSAMTKLENAGFTSFIDYFSIADVSSGALPQVEAIRATREDYRDHPDEYEWVRQCLADAPSLDTFDRILQFRLTGNLNPMTVFDYAPDRQYFEPFLNLSRGEVFVDGGGFDGFTSQEFVRRCPEYGFIHFFEPSEATIAVAQGRLSDIRRIQFHPVGLFNRAGQLCFDSSSGSASKITESGTDTIQVGCLDDLVSEPVSFIKLDLEGADLAALEGAKRHILADHPKIAVAVYHCPMHFREIPQFILGLREDYDLYLRHYTEGWTETIMFFIPK